MTTPTAAPEPFSAEGAALIEAGYPLDAVELLRQAVAAGEPSAPDLLVRAYLESGSWHAAAEWLSPLVATGHVRFAGPLGLALVEIGDRDRAEEMLRLAIDSGDLSAANDLAILLRDADRAGEAVHVLVQAGRRGRAVRRRQPGGAAPGGGQPAGRDRRRPSGTPTRAARRPWSRWPRCGPSRTTWTRRSACTGGPASSGRCARTPPTAGSCSRSRGDWAGAEREFREAERRAEPGWAYTLGRFLLDDGRPDEARGYLQLAAEAGDNTAAETLIELDGDPTDD